LHFRNFAAEFPQLNPQLISRMQNLCSISFNFSPPVLDLFQVATSNIDSAFYVQLRTKLKSIHENLDLIGRLALSLLFVNGSINARLKLT